MTADLFDQFDVGDEVWCLAWVGMPFEVVGKVTESRIIQIDGTGPCSLPEGASLDLLPQNHYLLTHERWDQIWYWPDIAGDRYSDVVGRFVADHSDGEIVTGYRVGMITVEPQRELAMAFRLIMRDYVPFGQIKAQPVVALTSSRELLTEFDPVISDGDWVACGPVASLDIRMIGYRWAITFGPLVLNWVDFEQIP